MTAPRIALALLLAALHPLAAAPSLEDGFAAPPKECRPQVWWWFDPSAPDAAILRDLEGMKRVGVSGFHIYMGRKDGDSGPGGFDFDKVIPPGEWVPKVRYALREANRLGLDAFLMIGVAGCGHPATDVRHAIKGLAITVAEGRRDSPSGAVRASLPARVESLRDLRPRQKKTPLNADGSPKWHWDVAALAVPRKDGGTPPSANEVRDVSRFLDRATGEFAWPDAPEGEWTILRVGYMPLSYGYSGYYIDHMSRAAFDAHWENAVQPLLDLLSPVERASLKGVMCDSWEIGFAGWTDGFPEEFRRRRGYDILPWIPVKAGIDVGTPGDRARFLRDFDETVSELIAENHYAYQRQVANRCGLLSVAEAAGPNHSNGDVRRMQGRCDVAMGEFWTRSVWPYGPGGSPKEFPPTFRVRDAATAAHVYGMGEVLAEAFTTVNTSWMESPATLKPCADRAFCDGLTRVCYHGMMLSHSLVDKPGDVRRPGIHYNPQTTWFEYSGAFNLYLSRCSWMLSQGRFAADCLIYAGDGEKILALCKTPSDGLGDGYDYDFCPTELLLRAHVEDGWITLPCGMRYRALLLSDKPQNMKSTKRSAGPAALTIGVAAMEKLRELAEAGAVVVGRRPEGPAGLIEPEARFRAAADAMWGRAPNAPRRIRVGKGWILADRAEARAFLAERGVGPDFSAEGGASTAPSSTASIDWMHRTLDGDGDVYFVSNQTGEGMSFRGVFREGAGKCAELWDAVTGIRRPAGVGPALDIALASYGSAFVVFRPCCGDGGAIASGYGQQRPGVAVLPGPWSVSFDPAWGGPKSPVVFDSLVDWTSRPEAGIRHYSGTAVYRATFDAPPGWRSGDAVRIDLGTVREVADVFVNGAFCGTAWTAPFAVTACNAREHGNVLEVRVANLWLNRLIYDSGLPEGDRLTRSNIACCKPTDALLPSGLLGPVSVSADRPGRVGAPPPPAGSSR